MLHVWHHETQGILASHGQQRQHNLGVLLQMCTQPSEWYANAIYKSFPSQRRTLIHCSGHSPSLGQDDKRPSIRGDHIWSIFQADMGSTNLEIEHYQHAVHLLGQLGRTIQKFCLHIDRQRTKFAREYFGTICSSLGSTISQILEITPEKCACNNSTWL